MGLGGIFKRANTMEDTRNRLHSIIGSLKASCLLLEGNTSVWIQMHDIVREVAISIASRDQHAFVKIGDDFKGWPTKDFLKSYQHMILRLCDIYELPERFDCPNVKFFYLYSVNRSLYIPDTIFEGMGSLKVLDLTRLNLSSLPTSLRSLTDLHTLCLDLCVLENMDAIGALKNLEILSLRKISMIKLPSEIGKLTSLRMLDLSNSGIEVIPPNIISSLTKLELLYMGNTSIKWEDDNSAKQSENASLAELQQLSNLKALELQIREAWILPRDMTLMFEKLQRYKIVIGDVWEWSDIKDQTLKTLKLKLGTNIHLEHGIKALVKGVEDLYLDEVHGIQNVLYQLNGEGFPLLKHLHIQNNTEMKNIVDYSLVRKNHIQVSFLNLETLKLLNLPNLEEICHGPLAVNSFSKLRVIKVQNCIQLKYLLSILMMKGLSQISEIQVSRCNSMETIVLGDGDITTDKIEFLSLHSLTLQHLQALGNFFSHELKSPRVPLPLFSAQVAFPKLDTLKLSSLNLNKIWEDNQHSMYNLRSLIVESCGGLKYLFSSTMVGSFMNLKRLEISKCHLMDEIIATEERNTETTTLEEDQFSKLETIILKDMQNLKTVWHYQFDTLKTLQVNNCEKILVVFPSSMQKTYHNLEMLEVTKCALVEEIFELASNEMSYIEDTTHLKRITLDELPKLQMVWSMDPQGILSFHNLENVDVRSCESLEHLFPLSVATSCSHLQELQIKLCGNMKEIVAEEKESMCTTPIFEFNQLNTLSLWGLLRLKGFYAGNYTLVCPSLRTIDVSICEKLNLFKTLSTDNPERFHDDKLPILVHQPLFIDEEVIPNLEKLTINYRDTNMILQAQHLGSLFTTKLTFLRLIGYENEEATFPYWFLQNAHALESLCVHWSSFKKIFQDERHVSEKYTRLKWLTLSLLPKLEDICEEGSQVHPILEFLEFLYIIECHGLRNLLPSSGTFSHLIYLVITNCNGLINLITSPTAQSLSKLKVMNVENCNSLEEIIIGKENVDIAFISLQVLKLECLPRLNKFCSNKCSLKFPLLEEVFVRECPRMKNFSDGYTSTPNLRKVKIAENNEEWHWKGSLNDTIKNMFDDKVAFHKLKHLTLSEYPELKDLWYSQPKGNVFCNLKSLVVQRCDFLSHVLFPSNVLQVLHKLEELEVRNCDSLETVFDVKGMKSKQILVKQSTQLKTLTLAALPNLKHIWNEDPHEIISFGNLCIVDVVECQNLSNIFPLSLCQNLGHLEVLKIESCEVEEIVAMKEGLMKNGFSFPQFAQLALFCLKNLKGFYLGKHTLECPSLKIFKVYRCEALRMFSFNHLQFQEPDQVGEIHDMREALFSIEKVSPNLEDLALNGEDALRILNGYCEENLFHKVELLRLQCFNETPTTFLNCFHAIFPNLVTLQVRDSSFDTLFLTETEGTSHLLAQSPKQIRNLWLYELEKLKYIWQEGFPLDHLVGHDLEGLSIRNCPNLIRLLPSSMSLKNLTYLEVDNCKWLTHLMTSSTAKSLVQLTKLVIVNCEMIFDVVKSDEEKEKEDIIFEKLEYLEFTSLSRSRSFCFGKHTFVFPSLTRFIVKGCPQMKIFSLGVIIAPFLTSIEVEDQKMRWKDDVNATMEQLFIEQRNL